MKKLLLIFLIPLCNRIHSMESITIYLPQEITRAYLHTLTPQQKEVAWDIHNVLAQKEHSKYIQIPKALWQDPGALIRGLYNLLKYAIFRRPNSTWQTLQAMKKLPKDVDSSGEAYLTICTHYKEEGLAKITQAASNNYIPRPGMEEIVNAINNKGITQRFASNIGPVLLQDLKTKFKKYNSHMLDTIQPGKIVNYNTIVNKIITNPSLILSSKDKYLATTGKPHEEFFESYNTDVTPNTIKTKFFVDDKLENVIKATTKGWVGIHFEYKKPNVVEHLRDVLIELGILDQSS